MSGWKLFNGCALLVHDALEFRGEPNLSILPVADVERFYATVVSRCENILPVVGCQDNSEYSIKFSDEIVAKFLVELNDWL